MAVHKTNILQFAFIESCWELMRSYQSLQEFKAKQKQDFELLTTDILFGQGFWNEN